MLADRMRQMQLAQDVGLDDTEGTHKGDVHKDENDGEDDDGMDTDRVRHAQRRRGPRCTLAAIIGLARSSARRVPSAFKTHVMR